MFLLLLLNTAFASNIWIGDSHTVIGLGKHAKSLGMSVYAKSGSGPKYWSMNYPTESADITFIALGDNGLAGIDQLLAKVKTPCYWISPTWGEKKSYEHMTSQLRTIREKVIGKCEVVPGIEILSRDDVDTTDGIHLTMDSYRLWFARIHDFITRPYND